MQPALLAFHGDPAVKEKYVRRVLDHQRLDQIIQRVSWDPGTYKGCAVGCTLHKYDHLAYERELGIPLTIAHLEDVIFESLPIETARQWPARFLKAIPVGSDLSMVTTQFLYWFFSDGQAAADLIYMYPVWRVDLLSRHSVVRTAAADLGRHLKGGIVPPEEIQLDAVVALRGALGALGALVAPIEASEQLLELLAAAPIPLLTHARPAQRNRELIPA